MKSFFQSCAFIGGSVIRPFIPMTHSPSVLLSPRQRLCNVQNCDSSATYFRSSVSTMNSVTCRYHPKAPLIEDYRAGDQVHCQTLPKAQGLGSFQVLSVSTQLKFNFARFGLVVLVWFGLV